MMLSQALEIQPETVQTEPSLEQLMLLDDNAAIVELQTYSDEMLSALYWQYKHERSIFEQNDIAGQDCGIRGYLSCLPPRMAIRYQLTCLFTDAIRKIQKERKELQ